MSKYIIYLTTNIINNHKYIGQHKILPGKTIETDHYLGSGDLLLKAIQKYGRKNFKREVLAVCDNRLELDKLECEYMEKFNALEDPEFYNIGHGGQFWRNKKFSKFMSNKMNEFYQDNERSKKFYQRLGYKDKNDYIEQKEQEELNKKRHWLINKLKWIKNLKKKEENKLCGLSNSEKTRLEWTIPEIRRKRIKNQKKTQLKRWKLKNRNNYKIIDGVEYKKCSGCNKFLIIDNFSPDKRISDGHNSKCRKCKNKSEDKNKKKLRDKERSNNNLNKQKEYYKNNPVYCKLCKRKISFDRWLNHRNIKYCYLCQRVYKKKIIMGVGAIRKC